MVGSTFLDAGKLALIHVVIDRPAKMVICWPKPHDEDVARLSAYGYGHINMLGRYFFAMPDEVIRPLRTTEKP